MARGCYSMYRGSDYSLQSIKCPFYSLRQSKCHHYSLHCKIIYYELRKPQNVLLQVVQCQKRYIFVFRHPSLLFMALYHSCVQHAGKKWVLRHNFRTRRTIYSLHYPYLQSPTFTVSQEMFYSLHGNFPYSFTVENFSIYSLQVLNMPNYSLQDEV